MGRPTLIYFLFNLWGGFGGLAYQGDRSPLLQIYVDKDFPIGMDTRCFFLLIRKGLESRVRFIFNNIQH